MRTLTRYLGFMGTFFFLFFKLLSWMFEHDYLDTCCFVFLYLHLFSATEHASHGKAL